MKTNQKLDNYRAALRTESEAALMPRTKLLSPLLVQVRLKIRNHPVAWVISRAESRNLQERMIRFWNKHRILPALPFRHPAARPLTLPKQAAA